MGCNDYNLHLDSSEGNESPTPEYNIYLDGVGVNGYSPTISFTPQTSEQFYITVNDINGTQVSPDGIPKMSYLTNTYVSNTSLASTLANYSTTSEIASAYLKVDGSNASNSININNLRMYKDPTNTSGIQILNGSSGNSISSSSFVGGNNKSFEINYGTDGSLRFSNSLGYAQLSYLGANLILENSKLYYGSNSASNEIATIGDIGNGTITITQGGVTKGTFTTNQSGNTTIELDAGGGSTPTVEEPLYVDNGVIKLAIDTDTLSINSDNELTVIGGGGGTTYTAGTGIDITSDVISVDNTVAMKTDIPDTTYMVTTNTAQTISGVKTFSSETHHTGVITFDSALLTPIIRATSGANYRNMIYRTNSSSSITVGNSNDTIDLKGSGTRPTYNSNNLALYSDIPTNSTYVDLTSSQTITGKKAFSGAELETNNIITLSNNAIIRGLHSGNYSTYLSSNSTSLLLGNESNNIILRGNTARPVYRTNSTDYNIALSGDIPTNSDYVDLTTDQNIAGTKAFTGTLRLISGSTVIRNSANTGNIGAITSDTTSLIISTPASNRNINLKPNGTGEVQANGNKVIDETDLATTSTAGIVQPDGSTITVSNGVVKTEGVINQQDNTTTLKYWTGTKQQYDGILNKDGNTLYNITDDTLNLNNVANTDLSNLTDTGKIAIAHNAMPSDTTIQLTSIASGGTYTNTLADGYITIDSARNTSGDTLIMLQNNNTGIGEYAFLPQSWYSGRLTIPVRKGETITASGYESANFFFTYAQGSESEVS